MCLCASRAAEETNWARERAEQFFGSKENETEEEKKLRENLQNVLLLVRQKDVGPHKSLDVPDVREPAAPELDADEADEDEESAPAAASSSKRHWKARAPHEAQQLHVWQMAALYFVSSRLLDIDRVHRMPKPSPPASHSPAHTRLIISITM